MTINLNRITVNRIVFKMCIFLNVTYSQFSSCSIYQFLCYYLFAKYLNSRKHLTARITVKNNLANITQFKVQM